MAGPDFVLFVVGALLLSGATAAIVTTDGGLEALGIGGSALGIYGVSYATRTVDGETADVPSLANGEVQFDVANMNVTSVTVIIACSDPVPGNIPYTLTVTVAGPNNLSAAPVSGPCGQGVEVPVSVATMPSDTTVNANTEAEARQRLSQDANATRAVGTWTVTVSGQRASAPAPLPGQTTPSGTVALRVEVWGPSFSPVQK